MKVKNVFEAFTLQQVHGQFSYALLIKLGLLTSFGSGLCLIYQTMCISCKFELLTDKCGRA